jgi:N12 class adenine-specific DNA methylase/flagellum-specific peptidoglycan hydrolase FlgJ
MALTPEEKARLQEIYASLRSDGFLKKEPRAAELAAGLVKDGVIQDLSKPLAPKDRSIDYDPDAGAPGAASMTGTASNRVPIASLTALGRPRSRPYDFADQSTAGVPKAKQAQVAARAPRKMTRPESRIAGRETYTRPGSFRDMAEGAQIGIDAIIGKPGEADIVSKALGVPQAGLAIRGMGAALPPYISNVLPPQARYMMGLPAFPGAGAQPGSELLAKQAVDTYLKQTGGESMGALSRSYGETLPAAAGTMATAAAGGRAAAMIPGPWWAKPIYGVGGAILAGAGGGTLIDELAQGGAKSLLGNEANRLFEQRGIDQTQYPGEAAIGRTAAQAAFLRPSTVDIKGLPMIARAIRSGYAPGEVLASPLGQEAGGMALNRLIGGGLPIAQEAIQARREGREMRPDTLLSSLVGMGLPDANRAGRAIGGVAGEAVARAAGSQYARSTATRAGGLAGDILYGKDRAYSDQAPVQTAGGEFVKNPDGSIKLFTRGSSEHIQALRDVAGVSPDLDSARGFRDITEPLERPGRTISSPLEALRGRFQNRPGVARPMAGAPDPATLVQPPSTSRGATVAPGQAPSPVPASPSAPLRVSKLATPAERRSMFARVRAAAAAAGDPHPDVTAAQWAYESDWGRKTSGANNYFGVKDHGDGSWTGQSVEKRTKEKNGTETITARFRSYDTPEEGIADLLKKKTGESRYQGYGKAMTPAEAARALQDGGYAQDTDYAAQLDRIMRAQGVNTHAPSGKAAPAPISSSMVTFTGKAKGDSGKVNPQLVARIQAAAEAAGIKASITTATTGHSKMTTSGNVSRHGAGHGVDIASLDGVTYASNPKLFTQKAEALAKALEGLGASRNAESGHDFAVLFGFDDPAKGGNHKNHLHVSYRGSSPITAGSPAPSAPPLPVAEPSQQGAPPSLTEMLAGGTANQAEQQAGAVMNEAEATPQASLTEMLAGGSQAQTEAPAEPYAVPHTEETPPEPATEPDYEARYRQRIKGILNSKSEDEAARIRDSELSDPERHFEGTGRVESAMQSRRTNEEFGKRKAEQEAADQRDFDAGQWVTERTDNPTQATLDALRKANPDIEYRLERITNRGDVNFNEIQKRRKDTSTASAPEMTFEQYKAKMEQLLANSAKYTDKQAGRSDYIQEMAALSEKYPEFEAQLEADSDRYTATGNLIKPKTPALSSLPASVQAIIDALPVKPNPATGARAHAENYAKWIAGGRQGKSPDYTPTTIKAQTAQNMERKVNAAFDEELKKPMRPQQPAEGVAPLTEAEAKTLNAFTGRTKGAGIWKAGDVPHAAAAYMLGDRKPKQKPAVESEVGANNESDQSAGGQAEAPARATGGSGERTPGAAQAADVPGASSSGDATRVPALAGGERTGAASPADNGEGAPVRRSDGDRGAGDNLPAERGGSADSGRAGDADAGIPANATPDLKPDAQIEEPAPTEPERTIQNAPAPKGKNFVATPDQLVEIANTTKGEKQRNLVAALETLKKLEEEGRLATPEEQEILLKFPGWGWTGNLLSAKNENTYEFRQIASRLTEDEMKAARGATRNSHYTAPEIITSVWDAMKRLGFMGGGRVLEPSTGNGLFYIAMPSSMRKGTSMMAIEKDSLTGRIARQLLQGTDVHINGLENVRIADNSLDLIISNIPFGNYAITDIAMRKRYGTNAYTNRIHNYFFIKSIEKARPGGVIAFIVSDGFLDARDLTGREVRKFVQGATDFLGAIRLPNDAFAKNAGTEVTTDIVFLRKKGDGLPEVPFENIEDLAPVQIGEQEAAINGYFVRHPEMVLGEHSLQGTMYKENDYALISDGRDMAEALKKAIKRLPAGAFVSRSEGASAASDAANDALSTALSSKSPSARARRGGLAIVTDASGKEMVGVNTGTPDYPSFEPIEADDKTLGQYKTYVALRDVYTDLVAAQLAGAPGRDAMRADLKKQYDALVKALGGSLHSRNAKLFIGDPDFYTMLALEKWDSGKKTVTGLSDAFTRDTITPNVAPSSADSASDALAAILRTSGVLDMDSVAKLSRRSVEEATEELIGQGLVFRDPAEGAVVTRDEYGSGNVKRKLREAEELAASEPAYAKNVEFLKTVQPRDVEPGQLSVGIGAPWVPMDVNKSFLEHLGVRGDIQYSPHSAKYDVTAYGFADHVKATATFGVAGYGAGQLFNDALNGKVPTIRDRDGVVDETRTTEARTKLAEVKEEWKNWIFGDAALLGRLTKKYNDEVNVYRYRRYDGSLLTFPGQNPMPFAGWNGLRVHQKNAIWRTIVDPFVLLGHEVGTGKTFTMITSAMELKRMGLRSKSLMVLKKSTIGQFAASFRALYPQAKLLVADNTNWGADKRKEFMAQIATNDWDAILVWHDAFKQLSVSPEGEKRFVQEEIDALEEFLREQQRANGSTGRSSRNLAEKEVQNKIDRLKDKIETLQDAIGQIKDDAIYWEDLGVDEIFADEAQVYKNLAVESQNQQLKNDGNQITFDMHMKLRLLRERGGGAVFATGTPLTNSISEVFSLLKYMRPDLLKEQNIQHFDAWVRSFAETENNFEQNVAGQFVEKTRYSLFKNLPELAQLYRSFADQVLAENVPELKRPKLTDFDGKVIDGPIVVKSQPDRYQLAYFNDLVRRAKAVKKQNPFQKGNTDNLLAISVDGRHVSLDPRLRISNAPDDPDSKINKMVGNLLRLHNDPKHTTNRRTQLVFMDLGQPGPDRDFDLYNDVTEKLVRGGVKREEIAWVQNAKTDDQKEALFEKVDTGQIRILLGSRERMGVGVNVQKRLIAIHQADPTWRPDQFEQADGRILRHGNLFSEDGVHICYYVNEGSFDAFMYGKLKTKSGFIKQFQNADENLREIEDDSSESFSFAEIYAAATGEPRVAEYLGLENDLKRYDSLRRSFAGTQVRLAGEIEYAQDTIPYYQKQVEKTKAAIATRDAATGEKFEAKGNKGEVFTERKALGEAILNEMDRLGERGAFSVGTIRGFQLRAEGYLKLSRDDFGQGVSELRPAFTLREPKSGLSISVDGSRDPVGMVRTIENRLGASLDYDLVEAERTVGQMQEQLPKLIEESKKPWRYEAEYAKAQTRYMELKPIIGEMLKNAEQGGFGSTVAKKEGEEDVKLEIRQKAATEAEATETEGMFHPLDSIVVPTAKIPSGDFKGQWPGIGVGHAFSEGSKYLGNNHGFALIAGGEEKLVKAYQKKRADMTGQIILADDRLDAFVEKILAQEMDPAQVAGYVVAGDSRRKVAVVKSEGGVVKFFDAEKIALLMRLSGADGLRLREGGTEMTKGGEFAGLVMPLADNALSQGLIRSIAVATAAAAKPELEETPQAEGAELASPMGSPSQRSLPATEAQRSMPATHKGGQGGELNAPIAPASARILVDPLPASAEPLPSHHQLIKDLAAALNRRIRVASQRRGVKGSYAPATGRTTIRFHGDVETTAHEAGHAIDDAFGLGADWAAPRARSPYDAELFQPALQTTTLKSYTLKVKRAESIAEWLRLYMFNPTEARRIAPTFTAYAEGKISAEVRAAMKNYGYGVRRIAGASATERVALNIDMYADEPGGPAALLKEAKRRIEAEISWYRGEDSGVFLRMTDRLARQWQDSFRPVERALEFARSTTGKEMPRPSKDPMKLLRIHSGVTDKVERILSSGPIMPDGKRVKDATGPDPDANIGGLEWLLEPLLETSIPGSERNLELAAILGVNERTIEKARELGRDSHISGIAAGLGSDVAIAEASIAEIAGLPEEHYNRLKEGLRRYRAWSDYLIDYDVASGRISEDAGRKIKAENQQYISFQRVMDEGIEGSPRLSRGLGSVGKPGARNRIKGSDRAIQNPFVSLMKQTHEIIAEADRNAIVRAFFDEFRTGRSLYDGAVMALESIAAPVQGGRPGKDENVIKFFVDGKEERWDVHPELFTAFKALGTPGSPQDLLKVLSFLSAQAPRYLITHNPAFAGRNLVRDALTRPFISQSGSTPLDSFKRFSKDDRLAFYLHGGGNSGNYLASRKSYARAIKLAIEETSTDNSFVSVLQQMGRKTWDGYNRLIELSEEQGRMAEYTRAFEKGKKLGFDDFDASIYGVAEARGLMDFAVGGTAMQSISPFVPFIRAAVQGTTALFRSAKRNPALFGMKFAMMAVASLIPLLLAAARGKDDLEEYRNLPSYQRDLFFNFKLGPDFWVRIPKGFEVAVLASGIERGIDRAMGNERAFDGYFVDAGASSENAMLRMLSGQLAQSMLPIKYEQLMSLGGVPGAMAEIRSNYDTFRQRHIVSPFEENIPLERRKGAERASRVGKILGKVLKSDPRAIDHFIQGVGGGAGQAALAASDIGRADKSLTEARMANIVTGLTSGSPSYASPVVERAQRMIESAGFRPHGGATNRPNPADRLQEGLEAVRAARTPTDRDKAARLLRRISGEIVGDPVPFERKRLQNEIVKRELQIVTARTGEADPEKLKKLQARIAGKVAAQVNPSEGSPPSPEQLQRVLDRLKSVK